MNLLPTAEQNQLMGMVQSYLADKAPVSRLRESGLMYGNEDASLLSGLGELGLIGISVPEEQGGTGLGVIEEVLVHQALGQVLFTPSLTAGMIAAGIAVEAGKIPLLEAILSGETVIGLAIPKASREGGGEGPNVQVFEGKYAKHLLWIGPERIGLVERADLGELSEKKCADSSLTLETSSIRLHELKVLESKYASHARLNLLLAAYCVGIASATTDMAVGYAKIREQFGKPIGSFQAVKHKCAEMAMRAEAARCQSNFAAVVMRDGSPASVFQASASKIVSVDAAIENAGDNIQVHGAIGFTSEADAHWYLKRARILDAIGGNLREQRRVLLDQPLP